MGIGEAARSQGDVMNRLRDLEDAVRDLQTARRLESASVGAGGMRIQGGRLLAEDASGDDVFQVTTEPPSIFLRPELIATVARQVIAETVLSDIESGLVDIMEGSFSDSGFLDLGGPELTFETVSGRWLLMLIAQVENSGDRSGAWTGYDATGAQSISADGDRSALITSIGSASSTQSSVYVEAINGTPGEITVGLRYRLTTGSEPGAAGWTNRSLVVISY